MAERLTARGLVDEHRDRERERLMTRAERAALSPRCGSFFCGSFFSGWMESQALTHGTIRRLSMGTYPGALIVGFERTIDRYMTSTRDTDDA